jgi:hypothetical protein
MAASLARSWACAPRRAQPPSRRGQPTICMAMKKVVRRVRKEGYIPLTLNSPDGAEAYANLDVRFAADPELEKRYRAHVEFAQRLRDAERELDEAEEEERPYFSEPVPAKVRVRPFLFTRRRASCLT